MVVDHINHDTLDLRSDNLRKVTSQVNAFKKSKSTNKTSKYIGVHYLPTTGKFHAELKFDGKSHRLGTFEDEMKAAKMIDKYAIFKYQDKLAQRNNVLSQDEISLALKESVKIPQPRKSKWGKGITKHGKRFQAQWNDITHRIMHKLFSTAEEAFNYRIEQLNQIKVAKQDCILNTCMKEIL